MMPQYMQLFDMLFTRLRRLYYLVELIESCPGGNQW